ncbi:MAG: ATP-binding protein [Dehalococcoidia bacterium]|nr:ATP-binding protein [Dehalococcoidia bacterium]
MTKNTLNTSGLSVLRPRARLLRTFGDELISSETVAVIELVKNAYDADATIVWIRFHSPLEIGKGMIEVVDNGHGMNLDTIKTTWMEPATLLRKRNRFSEKLGRRVLGEKGIGRFASSRLAEKLEVVTRRADMRDEVRVLLDWSLFDDEEKYLDEIKVEWEQRPPREICAGGIIETAAREGGRASLAEFTHGTVLRMVGLKTIWGTEQFETLRRGLSRLVSPSFDTDKDSSKDFEILLKLPEEYRDQDSAEAIRPPEIIKKPHYVIKGQIAADGKYTLNVRLKGEQAGKDKTGVFTIDGKAPVCGGFGIEVRVWNRDRESLSELGGDWNLAQIREYLDSQSGMSVYRDGFRVLPYGEPHNDWLRLDLRRIQNPTMRLSNNMIIGSVSLSSQNNPQLRDQSNREGIIEGAAFDNLKSLIIQVLALLETERHKQRPRKKRVAERGLFLEFDLASVREYVKKAHPEDVALLNAVAEKEKDLQSRVSEAEEVMARYRRLATLGNLIDVVLHDGRTPLSKIINTAALALVSTYNPAGDLLTFAGEMRGHFGTVNNQSDVLATLFRRIEPFGGRRRGRPARTSMETVVQHAFQVLEREIEQTGAQVELPNTYTEVTVDEAEIQEVIVNLLQNSLYWLKQVPKDKRIVTVQIHRLQEGELEIIFSDSGPGVPEENRDLIFDPYFSTKPNGVGLGLTIAGEIVSDYYDGTLELMKDGPQLGATFRILLRRRV